SRVQHRQERGLVKTALGFGGFAVAAILAIETRPSRSPNLIAAITKPECTIKGNISIASGNRVYHLPGMEDYETTVISPEKGERWFCTEAEAIEDGWNKAPR
ncbi:MAG: cold shock domain-containing protein, partial [Phormidesmis sp.]